MQGTLKHRRQFQRVYSEGAKAVGHLLVAFALCESTQATEVGIVASRKVGNAVRRSRAKRLLREAYRDLRPRIRPGTWLVLVARAAVAESTVHRDHVRIDLEHQLTRLQLLTEPTPDLTRVSDS